VNGVVDEMCNFRDESKRCSELNARLQAFSTLNKLHFLDYSLKEHLQEALEYSADAHAPVSWPSHGRRFSFNKIRHKTKKRTVIALRAVVDHVAHVGGLD
jgi:hypothetical protein